MRLNVIQCAVMLGDILHVQCTFQRNSIYCNVKYILCNVIQCIVM